jgi:hypothetical protein
LKLERRLLQFLGLGTREEALSGLVGRKDGGLSGWRSKTVAVKRARASDGLS